jgi:hypothetical protein
MDNQLPGEPLPLTQDLKARLRLFAIITRPPNWPALPGEKIWMILAFGPEEAIERAKQECRAINPMDQAVIYTGDFCWMDELIRKTKGGEAGIAIAQPPAVTITATPPIGIEGFKAGLLMAKNEYVESLEDKEILDRIIKSLEKK